MADIETFNSNALVIGDAYTRDDLADIGGVTPQNDPRDWGGMKACDNCLLIFVTLDKTKRKASIKYNDFFTNGGQTFVWQCRSDYTQHAPAIQRIIDLDTVLLFARVKDKIKGKTQPFIYVGEISAVDYENNKPVDFRFSVDDCQESPNDDLELLYQWTPTTEREPRSIETRKATKPSQKEKLTKKRKRLGQGRLVDPKKKKAIEMCAMISAKAYYEKEGYTVMDTSANHPYDYLCTKANDERRVEVKGTTQGLATVNVTINEVLAAREESSVTDLYIVHGIHVTGESPDYLAQGGLLKLISDWCPEDENLSPTAFQYTVPR